VLHASILRTDPRVGTCRGTGSPGLNPRRETTSRRRSNI